MLVSDLRTEDKGREGPLAMVLGLSVLHHASVPILPSLLSFHQKEGMRTLPQQSKVLFRERRLGE